MAGSVNDIFYDAIIQSLGFIAMGAGLMSFHARTRRGILIGQMICCLLFTLQLSLLDAISGAIINFIGMLRAPIYSMRGKYRWADSYAIPCVLIILLLAVGAFTAYYEGFFALLPALAMVVQSVAQFMTHPRQMRIISLFSSPCWMIYHLYVGSLGGSIGEIAMVISIIIALLRYKKDN
jgi:hypothetical protein